MQNTAANELRKAHISYLHKNGNFSERNSILMNRHYTHNLLEQIQVRQSNVNHNHVQTRHRLGHSEQYGNEHSSTNQLELWSRKPIDP